MQEPQIKHRSSQWPLRASLALLIIGVIGYFTLTRGQWTFYLSAHMGAVGVIGLLAVAVAAIAQKKGRSYCTAFLVAFLLPIILGLGAVFTVNLMGDPIYCGGSVSLAVALLILIGYAVIGKKQTRST